MLESKNMARLAYEALEDKKGEDIQIIDISNLSPVSDYFVIAHGNSTSQVKALKSSVDEKLGKNNFHPIQIEGNGSESWILMDYNNIVVHIFDEESRAFYDLEHIWLDGKEVLPETL